ncbi:MAG: NAD(P)-dependent alcohol dehydrogenase [Actinobacteria bacterium]|nr:NAD(P)-dependent alcohol dehydrogenase [Actinomycetota bacterium]
MKILAAVLPSHDAPFEIRELEIADPRPGEVLVRIVGVGMCHTDLLARIPGVPFASPIVLGHEGSGIVERVGEGVTKVAPGDKVVLSYASCGKCMHCETGLPQYCELFGALNFMGSRLDGSAPLSGCDGSPMGCCWFGQSSFATHAMATERNVVKVMADDVRLEILGPLGCGFQTGAGAVVNSLGARPGTSIVIYGAGAVGLAGLMAAKIVGCGTVVAVDLHENRLSLAKELGATHTINAKTTPDVTAEVRAITGGGTQYALDTTGVPAVLRGAVDALRPTGTLAVVGVVMGDISFSSSGFLDGKTIKGVIEGDAYPAEFIPKMIEWHRRGTFPIERLVKTYRLDEINQAQHDSESGVTIKPVFVL